MKKMLLAFLMFALCSHTYSQSEAKLEKRFDKSSIPPDILNKDYVLLVKIPDDRQKWIDKTTEEMKQHYTGQFEVVPLKTSIDEAYADTKKYRYVLTATNTNHDFKEMGRKQKTDLNPLGMGTVHLTKRTLVITDREDKSKIYNSGLEEADFLKILGFYAEKLSGK